jgi:nucleoside-diphosphate-sugar epimerase
MTHGEQIRDFIPVEDVAARFLAEAIGMAEIGDRRLEIGINQEPGTKNQEPKTRNEEPESKIRIAHIGSGRPQSLRQFAEYWWNHWEAKGQLLFGAVPYRENEIMRYVPDLKVNEL